MSTHTVIYFQPGVSSTVSLQPPQCTQDVTFCFSAFWGGRALDTKPGVSHACQAAPACYLFFQHVYMKLVCVGPCPMTPGGRYYYQPYFPDKETEAREVRLPACSGSKAKIPFQFGSGTGSYARTHARRHTYKCVQTEYVVRPASQHSCAYLPVCIRDGGAFLFQVVCVQASHPCIRRLCMSLSAHLSPCVCTASTPPPSLHLHPESQRDCPSPSGSEAGK